MSGAKAVVGNTTAEARLAYVAVTQARHHLDPIGLAWITGHPDNPA